eukprot:354473-Chlamydomonas_euryale.AAC.4
MGNALCWAPLTEQLWDPHPKLLEDYPFEEAEQGVTQNMKAPLTHYFISSGVAPAKGGSGEGEAAHAALGCACGLACMLACTKCTACMHVRKDACMHCTFGRMHILMHACTCACACSACHDMLCKPQHARGKLSPVAG